jgi:hypothetical protein
MSIFTKGGQNAENLGDYFDLNDLIVGSVAATTAQATATVTHGLTGTPDFFLVTSSQSGDKPGVASDSTTVTITSELTTAPRTYYYIVGDLT